MMGQLVELANNRNARRFLEREDVTLEVFLKLLKQVLKVEKINFQGINGLGEIYINDYRIELNPCEYGKVSYFRVTTPREDYLENTYYCIEKNKENVLVKKVIRN